MEEQELKGFLELAKERKDMGLDFWYNGTWYFGDKVLSDKWLEQYYIQIKE